MSVASMMMLTPRPSASIFTTTSVDSRNARKTQVMISAAQLMTRAVAARPSATLTALSLVRPHASRTLVSRNTS
jgi:hypothetical protein